MSKLEHIIRPRNDTLFFPLDTEVEMPSSNEITIPENKTHFLSEIIEDTVIPNKEKQLKFSNTDDIKPFINSSETYSTTNIVKIDDQINKISHEITINNDQKSIEEKNVEQTNDITQETIINNDNKSIKENIKNPVILENDKLSKKTSININVTESMDVESIKDLNKINESSDESEENDEDDVDNMLKDFIDSD